MVLGWFRRGRSQRSAADESLARLEAQSAAAPPPAVDDRVARGDAHMSRVMSESEALLSDVPAEQRGSFMAVVGTATDDPAGPLVTTTQHEGAVRPGDLVALVLLPDDPRTGAAGLTPGEDAEVLLGVRAASATVVAWDGAGRLRLTGVPAADLVPGSMISR